MSTIQHQRNSPNQVPQSFKHVTLKREIFDAASSGSVMCQVKCMSLNVNIRCVHENTWAKEWDWWGGTRMSDVCVWTWTSKYESWYDWKKSAHMRKQVWSVMWPRRWQERLWKIVYASTSECDRWRGKHNTMRMNAKRCVRVSVRE